MLPASVSTAARHAPMKVSSSAAPSRPCSQRNTASTPRSRFPVRTLGITVTQAAIMASKSAIMARRFASHITSRRASARSCAARSECASRRRARWRMRRSGRRALPVWSRTAPSGRLYSSRTCSRSCSEYEGRISRRNMLRAAFGMLNGVEDGGATISSYD
ncbi:Uncharacterised protein [Mycobacteroides abscessus subsp. abscessus]|nr:Uncharacterised protein [Mycobacteroides abscessus subsp. abscessus]